MEWLIIATLFLICAIPAMGVLYVIVTDTGAARKALVLIASVCLATSFAMVSFGPAA